MLAQRTRAVVYCKDVMVATGKSERTARAILAAIRRKHNKDCRAFVTLQEFCTYTGIPEDYVRPLLE